MPVSFLTGDCRAILPTLDAGSVQTCVTSPPYFNQRDYGVDVQIGMEDSLAAYIAKLVDAFRAVRRVLRDDATLWLNLGDTFASKQLLGVPWRVAFALQADGWYLRSDIIWHKPNAKPESVPDRPTLDYEHLFLFAKQRRYYYDAESVKEPSTCTPRPATSRQRGDTKVRAINVASPKTNLGYNRPQLGRHRRSVWSINTKPFNGAFFASFPPDLIEPCIKAGSRPGDVVLDPFGGAGTTALVAERLGRSAILIDLNPDYMTLARERIAADAPILVRAAD